MESDEDLYKYLDSLGLIPALPSNTEVYADDSREEYLDDQNLSALQTFPTSSSKILEFDYSGMTEMSSLNEQYKFLGDDDSGPLARSFVPSFTHDDNKYICLNGTLSKQKVQSGHNENPMHLCGLAGFCTKVIETSSCYCTKLWECDRCSSGLAVFIVTILILLGLAIIICNLLIMLAMYVTVSEKRPQNYVKFSLAIADLCMGIVILASVVPNTLNVMNYTGEEALKFTLADRNSTKSIVFGSLLVLSMTASVYLLFLMSLERFVVIQWPFVVLRSRRRKLMTGLTCTWLWSVLITSIPGWFPNYFGYALNSALQMYIPDIKAAPDRSDIHGIVYLFFMLIIPYILTVSFTVTTACNVRHKLKKSECMKSHPHNSLKNHNGSHKTKHNIKPEIAILKTTAIMLSGFTITLIPLAVAVSLFYGRVLDCSNFSAPYFFTTYLCAANSFVNFVIYSWRDKYFRNYIKEFLSKKKMIQRTSVSMTTTTSLRH